jgi:hypothetical protein
MTYVTYLTALNKTLGYRLAYTPNEYNISIFMVKPLTLLYPAYKERDPQLPSYISSPLMKETFTYNSDFYKSCGSTI